MDPNSAKEIVNTSCCQLKVRHKSKVASTILSILIELIFISGASNAHFNFLKNESLVIEFSKNFLSRATVRVVSELHNASPNQTSCCANLLSLYSPNLKKSEVKIVSVFANPTDPKIKWC